ncbi:MAG: hypothetical protein JW984_13840 [Deltaproteobacteria bacterium]|uniref:Uncharacterized protein n=1 Tax=Candidatus Zymogenus saltonus TaxID=2844893 RepID=A0A9D8KI01_9DELT|nr:hypothetical protein [Candidatus Zymogenus saltonus]
MKGSGWRFIIAMAVIGLAVYYFVIKEETTVEKPVDDTTIWADKVDAVAKMKLDMGAIAQAEFNAKMLDGKFIECAPNPPEIPDYITDWKAGVAEGWNELGVTFGSKTWFQYEVEVTGEKSFIIYARTYAEGPLLEYTMDENKTLRKSK